MSPNRRAASLLLGLTAVFSKGLEVEIHETFPGEVDQHSCTENNAASNVDPIFSRKISPAQQIWPSDGDISPTGAVPRTTPEVLQKVSTFTGHDGKRKQRRRVGFSHRDLSGDDSHKPYLDAFRHSLEQRAQIAPESPAEIRAPAKMVKDEEVRIDFARKVILQHSTV